LPTPALSQVDIARMNLLCAEGLPGSDGLDLETSLAQLDAWANRVKSETKRHWYRFERNPAEFEGSEGFFRMLMLTVVLAEDFGVHYDTQRRVSPETASENDGFFADARNVFLPGLLGPNRQGTCSSMPVLHVAIGRRLGYPLKLVTTKGHLFVRWEDAGERFNVEATGQGLNRFGDAYYRQWPFAVTEQEVTAEGYLKSLTPAEELAVFLSVRGMCMLEAGRIEAASTMFAAAAKLAPHCRGYRMMQARLESRFDVASQLPPKAPVKPSQ
jgi:hypothetical protein